MRGSPHSSAPKPTPLSAWGTVYAAQPSIRRITGEQVLPLQYVTGKGKKNPRASRAKRTKRASHKQKPMVAAYVHPNTDF